MTTDQEERPFPFRIRLFEPSDQHHIAPLWANTLSSAGDDDASNLANAWFSERKLGEGFDMHNIYEYYFGEKCVGRGCFWVAETVDPVDHEQPEDKPARPRLVACIAAVPVEVTPQNTTPVERAPPTAETLRQTKRCELQRLAVHVEWRRRGLARKLLERLEKWAVEEGFRECILGTLVGNRDAVELYRRGGWREHAQPIEVRMEELSDDPRHVGVKVVVIHFIKEFPLGGGEGCPPRPQEEAL